MRNLFIAVSAIGMLSLASACSNDDIVSTESGGEGTVTFALSLPQNVISRAFGEGTSPKDLKIAIYEASSDDAVNHIIDYDYTLAQGETEKTITLKLVEGKTYDFIFWAQERSTTDYRFDTSTQTLSVSYDNAKAADDSRDAFFGVKKSVKVSGPMSDRVELRRPFAQVNVGTNDIADALAVKTEVSTTALSIDGAYTKLNLFTGKATDPVKADFAAVPRPDTAFPFNPDEYDYLAMAYLLTGINPAADDVQNAQSELVNMDITITTTAGHEIAIPVGNVPVQRNYRTNIYGSLITSPFDWTVAIEPATSGSDINYPVAQPWDGKTVKSPAYDEATSTYTVVEPAEFVGLLQEANAQSGNNLFEGQTIKLASDLDFGGNAIPMIAEGASRKSGSAAGKAFTGVLDGNNRVISNFTIENTSSDGNTATGFIASLKGEDAIVKNLIFENVSLSSATAEQTAIVALVSEGATVEGIKVKSGSFTGTESTAGIVGRILSKGTVRNCENGATVHGSKHNIGGVIGSAYYANKGMLIENCVNTGDVTSDYMCAGGIVGFNCGDIRSCENSGTVKGTSSTGGIVGEQQNYGTISDCHNSGEVINTNSYGAGGIVGWVRYIGSDGSYPDKTKIVIEDCTNSASVTGATGVAGIAGMIYAYGTVRRCVNTAPSIVSFEEGWQEKYDSHKGTFASGIANQQSDERNHIDYLGDYEIIIEDNVSTTPIEDIIGDCNDVIIYVNDTSAVTLNNNSTTLP